MTYRKLTAEDLDPFIRMRIAQLREEGAREELDLVPALKDYYRRHLKDGTFVSWLAVDGEKIVGTSGMSFVEKPPYFSAEPSGHFWRIYEFWLSPDLAGAAGGAGYVRLDFYHCHRIHLFLSLRVNGLICFALAHSGNGVIQNDAFCCCMKFQGES